MKLSLSISALVLFFSVNAFACPLFEAQFIGKVTSVRVVKIDQGTRDCYLKVQFSMFNPHVFCPIDQISAEQNEILDYDCRTSSEVGSTISGILLEGEEGQLILE